MIAGVVVVSGPSGSGKSTLAELLGRRYGLSVSNVGDRLIQILRSEGIEIADRCDAGREYFARHSLGDYEAVVLDLARPGTVIDGLRRSEPLAALREIGKVLHVYRDPSAIGTYALNEEPAMAAAADIRVPWLQDRDELGPWVEEIVRRLHDL